MKLEEAHLVGIDGGGTHGRLLVTNTLGQCCRFFETEPLNISNVGRTDLLATLTSAFEQIDEVSKLASIHAGLAGVKTRADAEKIEVLLCQAAGLSQGSISVYNDIEPLLVGGLAGRPGIALIMGTGSHAMGRNVAGETLTCGGWGCLMDDAGSGYSIGLAALRTVVRMWDGRLEQNALAKRVMGFLELDEPGEALSKVHAPEFGFAGVNALGKEVCDWAADGLPSAVKLVESAVAEAMELVVTLARRLEMSAPEIVVTGGVGNNPLVRAVMEQELDSQLPGAKFRNPDFPPVVGAVIGAAVDAGILVDESFLQNLKSTLPNHHVN